MTDFRSRSDGSHYPVSGGKAVYPKGFKELNVKTNSALFDSYIHELLQNGFRVYCSIDNYGGGNRPISYAMIEKDGKLGYIQSDGWEGIRFSTVHKPNIKTGTGYSMNDTGTLNPTIQMAEEAINTVKPNWSRDRLENIQKYKSFEDYRNSSYGKILTYVEVKEI